MSELIERLEKLNGKLTLLVKDTDELEKERLAVKARRKLMDTKKDGR